MTKKYFIEGWSTRNWIVEVPDSITKEDIEHYDIGAEDFVKDWPDPGNTHHAYVRVHKVPEHFDDDKADVVLNHLLEVVAQHTDIEPHDSQEVSDG